MPGESMMIVRRTALMTLSLVLLLGACGGEMSLTEYVERMNSVADEAGRKGEELFSEADLLIEFTPQILQGGLERGLREIRIPLQEGVDAIDPPEQVADLHNLMWGWHARFISIEEALAVRAGAAEHTDAGWEELSDSPEMAAYRSAIAEGKQVCIDFQDDLDATAERGVFSDNPWLPGELKEVVTAALGCEWFPEHPEDVYRYPPLATT
jgi:hypothetical protein